MKIKLSRLQKVANPFDAGSLPFDDIQSPISMTDIDEAIAQGNIFESPDVDARENHIRHIAYLVCNYEAQTVVLNTDLAIQNKWWVTHNTEVLAAAIMREEESIEVLASGNKKLLGQLLAIEEEGLIVDEKNVFVIGPEWQAFDWHANLNVDMDNFDSIMDKMKTYDPESSDAVEILDYIKPHMLQDIQKVEELVDFMPEALKYMKEDNLNTQGVSGYVRQNPAQVIQIISKEKWMFEKMLKDENSIFGQMLNTEIFNNLDSCKEIFKANTHYHNALKYFSDEIKKSDDFLELYYSSHRIQNINAGQYKPTLLDSAIPEDFFNDEKRLKQYLKFGLSKEKITVDSHNEYLVVKNWIHDKKKVVEYLAYMNDPSEYKIIGRNNYVSEDKPTRQAFSKIYYALSKELRKDKDIVKEILPHVTNLYEDLPVSLRRVPEFMQVYLNHSENIEPSSLPKEVLFALPHNEENTKAIIRLISTNYGFLLKDDIPQSWKENIDFLMTNPEYLERMNVSDEIMEKIYAVPEYCEKIVCSIPEFYEKFPPELKSNVKYVVFYLRNIHDKEKFIEHIPQKLWNNHEFCIKMLDEANLVPKDKISLINENFWDDKRFLLKFFKALDYSAIPADVLEKAPEKIQIFLRSFDLNAGDYYQFFNRLFLTDKIKNQIPHQPEEDDSPKMKI
jgi:hypothetical protein